MSLIADYDTGLLLVGSPGQHGTGLLAVSYTCCCNGSGSGSGSGGGGVDCPECCCTEYLATITGVTGGVSCAADIDGVYTLSEFMACTSWRKALGGLAVILQRNVSPAETCGLYRLSIGPTIADSASATYTLNGDEWDCNGCNTMTLESEDGACLWPATVQVCCND